MKNKQRCCSEMEKATASGTDHEGYGAAIIYYTCGEYDFISIGNDLRSVVFCPWCGTKIGKRLPGEPKEEE